MSEAMLDQFDPHDIQDIKGARQAIVHLLNLVEEVVSENRELREENQRLRDENNRLKGEQGKPKVKPSKKTAPYPGSRRDHGVPRAARDTRCPVADR
jgi:regulator of replication initiation timing